MEALLNEIAAVPSYIEKIVVKALSEGLLGPLNTDIYIVVQSVFYNACASALLQNYSS